jgi:hypothetical protein
MGATNKTTTFNFLLSGIAFLLAMTFASSISAQIEAIGTCEGVSTSETYTIKITGLSSDSSYTILVDGVASETNTLIGTDTFMLTGFSFSDGTVSKVVSVIESPNAVPDTTVITVHEVLCIDADADGAMDFNKSTCDYRVAIPNSGAIVSTVAPFTSDHVYLYVLTDTSGKTANLLTTNYSGYFTGLENGEYRVSAFHFLDTLEAISFVSSIADVDLDTIGSGSDPICYNFCGNADYTVDCACLVSIDQSPSDQEVCEDDDANFYVVSSIDAPVPPNASLEYQWQVDTGTLVFYNLSGETDSTLSLTAVDFGMNGNKYRVLVTLDVDGTNICSDTSAAATLNINLKPILADDLDAVVCSDEAIGVVLAVSMSSVAADSFMIVGIDSAGLISSAGSPSLLTTNDPNIISDDAWTNTTGASVDVTYSVKPISADGCIGETVDIIVTISAKPKIDDIIYASVCSDTPISVQIPNVDDEGLAIDSFLVSASVGANLTGSATTGDTTYHGFIAMDMFNNISGANDTVTYTITPFNNGCQGNDFIIKVAITPEPSYTTSLDDSVCSDVAIGIVLPSVDDNLLVIDTFDIAAIVGDSLSGTATTGTNLTDVNSISGDIFTNTSNVIDTVKYTITPYSNGCEGEPFTIIVLITPEPVAVDPTPMVCSDEALNITLQDLIVNGVTIDTFTWMAAANANVTGETTTESKSASITDVLTNISGVDQTVIYTVIPKGDNGCIGNSFTVTVTVKSEPVGIAQTIEVCSDEALNVNLLDSISNGVDIKGFLYTVASSNAGDVPAASARIDTSSAAITDIYTNTTGSDVTITYTITAVSTALCISDTYTVTVTVHPEPVLATDLDATVCSDEEIGVVLAVESGSVTADSFNIVSINNNGLTSSATSPASVGITGDVNAIASDSWTNTGTDSVQVIYSVSPISADGCIGDTVDITVTIKPEVTVDAGITTTICSNGTVTLADLGASITGGATTGTWTSATGGTFDNSGDFATSTTYTPSTADVDAGFVILTLTSEDPSGPCPSVNDTVRIVINDVRCSQFPWNGNDD